MLLLLVFVAFAQAACPYSQNTDKLNSNHISQREPDAIRAAAVSNLNWTALKNDILALLTNSQSFWPADFGNYGPFFVRQAWHCAGSYRASGPLDYH